MPGRISLCGDGRISLSSAGKINLCCGSAPEYDNCSEFSESLDGKSVLISFSGSFTSPPDHLAGTPANFVPLTVDMSTMKQPAYDLEYTETNANNSQLWSRAPGTLEYTVAYFSAIFDTDLQQICRDYPSSGKSQIYLPYQTFQIQCSRFSSSGTWYQTASYDLLWKQWHYPTSDGDPDPTTQAGIDYLRDDATYAGDQFYRWQLQRSGISDYTISPTDLLTANSPSPPNSWDNITVSATFQ